MRITYDREVDAAYIYLKDISPGEVAKTVSVDGLDGNLNVDLDENGRILGLEILSASRMLPKQMIES